LCIRARRCIRGILPLRGAGGEGINNYKRTNMKKINKRADLTEEEKTRPHAKYFYKEPAKVPEDVMAAIQAGPMNFRDALPFEKINDLLNSGYHAVETGHCRMPDNTCYVAVLTKMPGVTGEMLDWWFWWHAVESLRYKIWYPGAHVGNSVENREQLENPSLSARERYWNNPQYPVEDVGIGPDILTITFIRRRISDSTRRVSRRPGSRPRSARSWDRSLKR
jgi:hypothetical protein